MKTFKIILAAFLLIPAMTMAQQSQKPLENAKKHAEWMVINLQLSEDQVEDIQEANEEYAEERMEIYTSNDDPAEKLEDLIEEREEYKEEIREALEDNQFDTFIEIEDDWFEEIKEEFNEWDD